MLMSIGDMIQRTIIIMSMFSDNINSIKINVTEQMAQGTTLTIDLIYI